METLLSIQNLTVQLMTARGIVYALSGVDMDMKYGEILGVVGESGCGKSMTAKSIMRLHPPRRTRVSGAVLFEGRDLLALPNREMEKLRGSEISMIFQDPMTSLNPLMTVGNQLGEMFRYHMGSTPAAALEQSEELLQKVGLSPAKSRLRQYPFELSGGMQQRVMIAMAIACKPKLLIADEPTTALDVTIQAQILELLQTIAAEMGMSVLLITHNFGVVAEICQRVSVMYGGKIMETGETRELLRDARHPYSRALIASIPTTQKRGGKLTTIPGAPPPPLAVPEACLFAPRCRYVLPECSAAYPAFRSCGDKGEHSFACLRGAEVRDLRPDGGEVAGHA